MMNNMNQFGMNPMGMNAMGISPMMMMMNNNNFGINNQPNLTNEMNLDATAQNIKNIIQPYENKIKELEEIIRQKDFEITVLKQKLNNIIPNNNIMNMNPMMNNLMNPMNYIQNNIMMENSNQSLVDRGKEIRVNLEIENKGHIVKCFERDKTSILKEKCNINKEWLSYDYRILNTEKTIKENEILDYSVVKVVPDSINIIFEKKLKAKQMYLFWMEIVQFG